MNADIVPGQNVTSGLWCRVEPNDLGDHNDPAGGWLVTLYVVGQWDHSQTHCANMPAVREEIRRNGFSPADVGWCVDNPPTWSQQEEPRP